MLLVVCSLPSMAKTTSARALPNPFADLPAYLSAVKLSADAVWVGVSNNAAGSSYAIEAVEGLTGFDITSPVRLGDYYSGFFTSRSNFLTIHLSGSGFAEAIIWINGQIAVREQLYHSSTCYLDISGYPSDAWIQIELADTYY